VSMLVPVYEPCSARPARHNNGPRRDNRNRNQGDREVNAAVPVGEGAKEDRGPPSPTGTAALTSRSPWLRFLLSRRGPLLRGCELLAFESCSRATVSSGTGAARLANWD
jgi:hypothetical protein